MILLSIYLKYFLTVSFLVSTGSCLQVESHVTVKEGFRAKGTVLQSKQTSSQLDCAHFCLRKEGCLSFNYKLSSKTKGLCELLSDTAGHFDVSQLVNRVGWMHGQIVPLVQNTDKDACCPPRWDKHGDSCYYVEKSGTSKWQDARKKCHNMRANLTIITSSDEHHFIANLTKKYNINTGLGIWFGLQRLADSKFYWIDGTPLDGHFQAWGHGQPDNSGGGENCGHMRGLAAQHPGQWNDLPCSLGAGHAPYPGLICEKSISYF
ncbi:C-type lectin domain family 10 member A-like [Montipora foliosa]|uniref:C-type lectin domain family 10 member A-like n=1 Tax=Montipora foliosa TaxID=591990 RepID=UPI0035F1E752